MSRNSRRTLKTATSMIAAFAATGALASQGPGVAPGTASAFTQTLMAVIVYGSSAVIVAWGLIGGLRRPKI